MFAYCGNDPKTYIDATGTRYVCLSTQLAGGLNYIYDQSNEEYADITFGNSTLSYSGCGAVATYNALLSLGSRPSLENIVQQYEQNDAFLLGGVAGISYRALADYFADAGYNVSMYKETELFDYFVSKSDAAIVWYTWANSGEMGMYFFHVDSTAGLNRGYNVYRGENAVRFLPSNLSDFFSGSNGKYAVLICIDRK